MYVVSIFLGKSPITVIPADPPFTALNFTSSKIYWNTINKSTQKVKNYILYLTQVEDGHEVNEIIIDGMSESYVINNLVQGVRYSYTIMARDSINRNGIESPPVEFIVDSKYSIYISFCCTFVSLFLCPSFHHNAYLLPYLMNYYVQYIIKCF